MMKALRIKKTIIFNDFKVLMAFDFQKESS
jgi:hypothetical protein